MPGTKQPGFSDHLVSYTNTDPHSLTGPLTPDIPTIVHAFKKSAKKMPEHKFLGRRDDKKEGRPYVWMTFSECEDYVTNLARGFIALDMMPDIDSEGRSWKFMGTYSKNRPEWVLADLASASIGGTTIAFYDTLGPQAVEFVINQTKLATITCAGSCLSKIILLKSQGKAQSITHLVSMDAFDKSIEKDGQDVGIKVFHINEVLEEGKKHPNIDIEELTPKADDIYMFCYTSGTTGDPKAAMLSHNNLISAASATFSVGGIEFGGEESIISYLPLAHSFEKVLFTTCCISGMAIGYYSGDPLQLLDDLKELKPTYFPSVPRLFNRIYDKIQSGLK